MCVQVCVCVCVCVCTCVCVCVCVCVCKYSGSNNITQKSQPVGCTYVCACMHMCSRIYPYHFSVVEVHHGEQDIGLEEVTPSMRILIHPTLDRTDKSIP